MTARRHVQRLGVGAITPASRVRINSAMTPQFGGEAAPLTGDTPSAMLRRLMLSPSQGRYIVPTGDDLNSPFIARPSASSSSRAVAVDNAMNVDEEWPELESIAEEGEEHLDLIPDDFSDESSDIEDKENSSPSHASAHFVKWTDTEAGRLLDESNQRAALGSLDPKAFPDYLKSLQTLRMVKANICISSLPGSPKSEATDLPACPGSSSAHASSRQRICHETVTTLPGTATATTQHTLHMNSQGTSDMSTRTLRSTRKSVEARLHTTSSRFTRSSYRLRALAGKQATSIRRPGVKRLQRK